MIKNIVYADHHVRQYESNKNIRIIITHWIAPNFRNHISFSGYCVVRTCLDQQQYAIKPLVCHRKN